MLYFIEMFEYLHKQTSINLTTRRINFWLNLSYQKMKERFHFLGKDTYIKLLNPKKFLKEMRVCLNCEGYLQEFKNMLGTLVSKGQCVKRFHPQVALPGAKHVFRLAKNVYLIIQDLRIGIPVAYFHAQENLASSLVTAKRQPTLRWMLLWYLQRGNVYIC